MPKLHSPFGEHFVRNDAIRLAAALKVLADPVRLRIIHLLHKHGQMTVLDLTPHLSVSQPTVSHHMHILQSAQLVRQVPGVSAVFKPRQLDHGQLSKVIDALLVGES